MAFETLAAVWISRTITDQQQNGICGRLQSSASAFTGLRRDLRPVIRRGVFECFLGFPQPKLFC